MHRWRFFLVVLAVTAGVVVAATASASRSGPSRASAIPLTPAFTASQLAAHAGANWLSVQGDLENDRYSTLTQIKESNVKNLKLAWHIHMGDCPTRNQVCSGEEANATVYNGVMYLENVHSQVFAINAATGKILWKVNPKYVQG